jgi:hypothetical protein
MDAVRVLRLIKLVRLLRTARVLRRLKSRVSIPYDTLRLIGCLVQVIIVSHWTACCMMLCTSLSGINPAKSYLGEYRYCDDISWS